MDFNKRAKEIIAENIYLVMSTSNKRGDPWISPVYCAYDEAYNFYWTSSPNARHSKNIKENDNKLTFVIFNSSAAEGTGEGVYFEAKAYELSDEKEVAIASQACYSRKNKAPKPASEFLNGSPRRMYKAVPEKIWMNTTEKVDGYIIDAKVDIALK